MSTRVIIYSIIDYRFDDDDYCFDDRVIWVYGAFFNLTYNLIMVIHRRSILRLNLESIYPY